MVQFTNSFSHKGERFTSVTSLVVRGQSFRETKDESLRSLGSSGTFSHSSMSTKSSEVGSGRSMGDKKSSTSDVTTDCSPSLGINRVQRSLHSSRTKSDLLRQQSSTSSKTSTSDLELQNKGQSLVRNGSHQSLKRPTSKYSDPEYWNKRYGKSLYIWKEINCIFKIKQDVGCIKPALWKEDERHLSTSLFYKSAGSLLCFTRYTYKIRTSLIMYLCTSARCLHVAFSSPLRLI